MNGKLDCIMIIDDSSADNFLHERLILRMGYAKHVVLMRTGHGAIDHITSYDKKQCLPPQLIFLDIEMPGMNGWEFVEAYGKLHESDRTADIIMMPTANDSPEIETIKANELVKDYIVKPLTEENLLGLMQTHYPN